MIRTLPHLYCLFSTPVVKGRPWGVSENSCGIFYMRLWEMSYERDCIRENRRKEFQRIGGGVANGKTENKREKRLIHYKAEEVSHTHTCVFYQIFALLVNYRINVVNKGVTFELNHPSWSFIYSSLSFVIYHHSYNWYPWWVQVRRAAAAAPLRLRAGNCAPIITLCWEDTGLTRCSLAFLELICRNPRKELVPLLE